MIKGAMKFGMLAVAGTVLAGCGSLGETFGGAPEAPVVCPDIAIISDGAKLVRFQPGPGRDILDVEHTETLTGFGALCEYDTDDTGAGTVVVELAPALLSELGPANKGARADFTYFVAAMDEQRRIAAKEQFPISLQFEGNVTKVSWQDEEPVTLTLPLKVGGGAHSWRIFIGLQLTKAELDYLRQNR